MKLTYEVTDEYENSSYKNIIKKHFKISGRLFNKLKNNGNILINSKVPKFNDIAKIGDCIDISLDFKEDDDVIPQDDIKLKVLYEDDMFLAVEKPANMVVHPTSLHLKDTLANYVKGYLHNNKKIRPINRLDNGTSGIVLFGKNEYAQELFKTLEPKPIKEYIAVVNGKFFEKEGIIQLPIARKEGSIIERQVDFDYGQTAITRYKVIDEFMYDWQKYSVLRIKLDTGRTHQIRVHLSYLGHPIVGDTLYGNSNKNIKRQALHACKMEFIHPLTHELVSIKSDLPSDINNLLDLVVQK